MIKKKMNAKHKSVGMWFVIIWEKKIASDNCSKKKKKMNEQKPPYTELGDQKGELSHPVKAAEPNWKKKDVSSSPASLSQGRVRDSWFTVARPASFCSLKH